MFSLSNRTALVTGAGSGIGRATAIRLAQAGCTTVFLTGRRRALLLETAALIEGTMGERAARVEATAGAASEGVASEGVASEGAAPTTTNRIQVVCIDGDITDAAFRATLVRSVFSRGPLDILVNNAGVYSTATFQDTSDADFAQLMAVNLGAVFALTRDFIPALEASVAPAVVNIGSTLSLRPIPQGAVYNVAKAGVDHLTRSLASELGARRIRVNCVSPGITETPMYRRRYASEVDYTQAIETASSWHPLGRVGRPQDIADAVVFLAGPGAAWITGVVLPVDGGLLVS